MEMILFSKLPIINESKTSIVYDFGNKVIKQLFYLDEYNLSLKIQNLHMKHVANIFECYTKSTSHPEIFSMIIVKEKIEECEDIKKDVVSLCKLWDEEAPCAISLFDRLNEFLKNEFRLDILCCFSIGKFYDYLRTEKHVLFKVFDDIISLCRELYKNKIYNIDWHPNNFGLKDGRLALFELGGAKIKE